MTVFRIITLVFMSNKTNKNIKVVLIKNKFNSNLIKINISNSLTIRKATTIKDNNLRIKICIKRISQAKLVFIKTNSNFNKSQIKTGKAKNSYLILIPITQNIKAMEA